MNWTEHRTTKTLRYITAASRHGVGEGVVAHGWCLTALSAQTGYINVCVPKAYEIILCRAMGKHILTWTNLVKKYKHSLHPGLCGDNLLMRRWASGGVFVLKGKGSSLDIATLTILDSGNLQPRKWQLIGIGCSTAAQASGCPYPALTDYWTNSMQPACIGLLRLSRPR